MITLVALACIEGGVLIMLAIALIREIIRWRKDK